VVAVGWAFSFSCSAVIYTCGEDSERSVIMFLPRRGTRERVLTAGFLVASSQFELTFSLDSRRKKRIIQENGFAAVLYVPRPEVWLQFLFPLCTKTCCLVLLSYMH
jgi:hypothetical protein